MPFHSGTLLVLGLVLSACSSSAGASLSGGGPRAEAPTRGNSSLIVRAELDNFQGLSAWEAVDVLRRRWTSPRRGTTFGGTSVYANVVVDGTVRGTLGELNRLNVDNIETMRYLSPADATTKYGTGFLGGIIEVSTIRGR